MSTMNKWQGVLNPLSIMNSEMSNKKMIFERVNCSERCFVPQGQYFINRMLQHTDRGRHLRRSPAGTTQKDDKVSSLRDLRRCCANDTGSFRATKL